MSEKMVMKNGFVSNIFWQLNLLFRNFQLNRFYIVLILLRAPFDFLLSMYNARLLSSSFSLIEMGDNQKLITNFLAFFVVTILLFLYNGTVWSMYAANAVKMHGSIRTIVFRKITGLSYQTLNQQPAGYWVTLGNRDVQMADTFFNGALNVPHEVVSTVNILGSAIVLMLMDYRLFGLAVAFIVPHVLISNFVVARTMTQLTKKATEEMSRFTFLLEPVVNASAAIAIYDAKDFMYQQLNDSSLKLRSINMEICKKKALNQAIMPLFGMTGYAVLLFVGGNLVSTGVMTFGTLTAILQYRGSLLMGSNMFINSSMNLKSNLAGIQRVNQLMEL